MKRITSVFLGLAVLLSGSIVFGMTKKELGVAINLAGRQRMLTQKMSKEVFLIAKGIDKAENLKNLKKTMALFDRTLKGLINGDKKLGLAKTKDKKIVAQLKKVQKMWNQFKKYVAKAAKGKIDKKLLLEVAKRNIPLLKEMNKAVKMYEALAKKGGKSALSPAMAKAINLAGRQRMLTQKMTKELLLISLNIEPKANRKNLKKTVALFADTLKGLQKGSKKLGLPAPPNKAIAAQLKKVAKLWAKYLPVLKKAIKGKISDKDLKFAAKINLPLLKEMNKAVKLYEKAVK